MWSLPAIMSSYQSRPIEEEDYAELPLHEPGFLEQDSDRTSARARRAVASRFSCEPFPRLSTWLVSLHARTLPELQCLSSEGRQQFPSNRIHSCASPASVDPYL